MTISGLKHENKGKMHGTGFAVLFLMERALRLIICALTALCATFYSLKAAVAADSLVEGYGAPRFEYEECNQALPSFAAKLAKHELIPVEPLRCVSIEEGRGGYRPVFRAKSSTNIVVDLVSGGRFNTLAYCQAEEQRLLKDLSKTNKIFESSCKRIRTPNADGSFDEVYAPAVLTIAERAGASALLAGRP